jgi:hypothetical protein
MRGLGEVVAKLAFLACGKLGLDGKPLMVLYTRRSG